MAKQVNKWCLALIAIVLLTGVGFYKKRTEVKGMAFSQATSTTGNTKGVDLSQYQLDANINWYTLRNTDKIDFVMLRASVGAVADTEAAKHVRSAKAVGMPIGFYHYEKMATGSAYSLADADAQAEFFANTIKNAMTAAGYSGYGDLLPVLDLEYPNADSPSTAGVTSQQILDWAKRFMDHFKAYTGRAIMLYSSPYFFSQYGITNNTTLAQYPLWVAQYYEYRVTNDTPDSFGGFNDWTCWQYDQYGKVQAYPSSIDLDWGPKSLDYIMPPKAPTGMNWSYNGTGSIVLNWKSATEVDIDHYTVYVDGIWKVNVVGSQAIINGISTTSGSVHKITLTVYDKYGDKATSTINAYM